MEKNSYVKTFLTSFLCASTMALAQNVQKPLEIQHIAGNSYNYITYGDGGGGNIYPTNSVYVLTKKGAVLIDGPWDPSQVEPLLDSIAKKHKQKVVLAITTHFHDDKTASLDMFKAKGIPTYAAQKTDEIALLRNEKRAQYHFSKDTVFQVGEYRFEVYFPGAGHTTDNQVVWIDKDQVLYGGCLVKSADSKGLGNIADANLETWSGSIENLIKKYPQAKFIIPGHHEWQDKNSLKHTLYLLQEYHANKTQ